MEPDKDFAVQMDKRALRKEVRARRMALILVTLLTVLCAVAAVCMLAKAVCIVNDGGSLADSSADDRNGHRTACLPCWQDGCFQRSRP